jgi:hypothetical protein
VGGDPALSKAAGAVLPAVFLVQVPVRFKVAMFDACRPSADVSAELAKCVAALHHERALVKIAIAIENAFGNPARARVHARAARHLQVGWLVVSEAVRAPRGGGVRSAACVLRIVGG